jgi:ferredoxin
METIVAFVVTESCIRCKHMDCVEVCPAQCFYEGASMLVINPVECIDCGLCEPTCPEDAILPDSYPEAERWIEVNQQYSLLWPNIRVAKDPPGDAADFHGLPDKFDRFFSPQGGSP